MYSKKRVNVAHDGIFLNSRRSALNFPRSEAHLKMHFENWFSFFWGWAGKRKSIFLSTPDKSSESHLRDGIKKKIRCCKKSSNMYQVLLNNQNKTEHRGRRWNDVWQLENFHKSPLKNGYFHVSHPVESNQHRFARAWHGTCLLCALFKWNFRPRPASPSCHFLIVKFKWIS